MEDITLRVLRALSEVDAIYAEDTRRTLVLLRHHGIQKPLISCHEHNENARAEEIMDRVAKGESVAFVSDAGMPCISDPGERLVNACIKANIPFEVLPGPSASLTALALSGFPVQNACFVGFLPRKTKPRRELLMQLASFPGTLIIYESPLRVGATLAALSDILGDRDAALIREITKHFEETVHGTLIQLAGRYAETPPRGECVLIVGGAKEKPHATAGELDAMLQKLLSEGLSVKDAAKQASAVLFVPRAESYRRADALKKGAQLLNDHETPV